MIAKRFIKNSNNKNKWENVPDYLFRCNCIEEFLRLASSEIARKHLGD